MTEKLAAAASADSVAERDVLLATKLHVPGPRPGFVPRPRLAGRLDEGLARGFILASAPAGYGKTVLLADWARRGEHPVAWLSLDAGDNDPARFWQHAVAALDRARPGTRDLLAPLLGPPAPASFQGLVAALINELAGEEALLVLDDYHVISARQVHESLSFLLEHRPAGVCVVLASRSDPPLGLARLRARGQLAEMRVADLRFTPAEAGELLQHAAPALPEASVAALAARTEGWAAGLALAALSLRGHDDAAGFVAAFTGSHRFVLDYLAEEVLERQDGQLRTFLLETSVLARLSGPLCDAVTGREGSQALLERAERAGLFLVPLDEVRGWWRYHHLFAGLLLARLQQEQPGRLARLHRNAAAWYQEHGLADDAIGHAAAAGEMLWAARIIEQHFDLVFYIRGEAATIHRWMSMIPAEVVRSRPRLLLAQAIMAATSGHFEVVEPLLDAVACAPPGWADEPFEPAGGAVASNLINVPALTTLVRSFVAQYHGDAEATAAFATQTLAEVKPGERMLSTNAQVFLAVAEWLRGRLTEAERAIAASVTGWREAGQLTLAAWSYYSLLLIQRAQGRLDAAVLTCQQALDTLVAGGRPAPAAGLGHVGLAEIAYQRDDLDLALRHATEGIELCRQFVYGVALADGLATLAMIRQATGDPAGALAAITEAGQASPGPAGLLNPVPARRARLLLAHGDLAAAVSFAQDNGLGPDDEPDYARESGHLVLARILLAQGRPGQALALLDRLHAAAAAQDRRGSLIEIGALRALALTASGDEAGAVTALAGALVLACPQGYVRVFADEGPPMAALLGRLIAAQRAEHAAARRVPLGCLARLQRAFDARRAVADPGPAAPAAVPGIVEPLTGRELEVLEMLAAGRPNQAIADELVVTLDTVKKHVGHVLSKLGAGNRTEAVSRARELSLIP
ncbi:MAG TPA: LuxR C-terminal-related transcriptional regulator [Streptosporangiaceae bacterium]